MDTKTPTIEFLDELIKHSQFTKSDEEWPYYMGTFAFDMFDHDKVNFWQMGQNRYISEQRVDYLLKKNIEYRNNTGKFPSWGLPIILLVQLDKDKEYDKPTFYVLDGQHRCTLGFKLRDYYIEKFGSSPRIAVPMTIYITKNDSESNNILETIQDTYPSDTRLFSMNEELGLQKKMIIKVFEKIWPKAFINFHKRENEKSVRKLSKNYRMELEKGNLSHGLVVEIAEYFDIYKFANDENILTDNLIKINNYLKDVMPDSKKDCCFSYIRQDNYSKYLKLIDDEKLKKNQVENALQSIKKSYVESSSDDEIDINKNQTKTRKVSSKHCNHNSDSVSTSSKEKLC